MQLCYFDLYIKILLGKYLHDCVLCRSINFHGISRWSHDRYSCVFDVDLICLDFSLIDFQIYQTKRSQHQHGHCYIGLECSKRKMKDAKARYLIPSQSNNAHFWWRCDDIKQIPQRPKPMFIYWIFFFSFYLKRLHFSLVLFPTHIGRKMNRNLNGFRFFSCWDSLGCHFDSLKSTMLTKVLQQHKVHTE